MSVTRDLRQSPTRLRRWLVWVVTLVAATATVAVGAAPASAARPATPAELAAFATAINAGDGPQCFTGDDGETTGPVAGSDLEGRVSTIDPRWAVALGSGGGCPMAEGRSLLHLVGGAWTYATSVSGVTFCAAVDRDLPQAVGVDLGMCSATPGGTVLGAHDLLPNGKGWGHAHPATIFNGGDPSGLVTHIRWRHWGRKVATGHGRTFIFKPHGGYYAHSVPIVLRASSRGTCQAGGQRTYRRLTFRVPRRPGGRLGATHLWSGQKTLCSWGD